MGTKRTGAWTQRSSPAVVFTRMAASPAWLLELLQKPL